MSISLSASSWKSEVSPLWRTSNFSDEAWSGSVVCAGMSLMLAKMAEERVNNSSIILF